MVNICLYFQVHEPQKIKGYRVFDIGHSEEYFDEQKNKSHILKLAQECYIPMNNQILDMINKYDKKLKVSFSISGITLELLEQYAPQVIDSFKALARTGCVEFISETYYHSLSFLYSRGEFKRQIELHDQLIKKHFNFEPKVFRNTELIYNNELANFIEDLGYKAILSEGVQNVLGSKNQNHIYTPQNSKGKVSLLFRNQKLSEDLSSKFFDKSCDEWPLNASKYAYEIEQSKQDSDVINIFIEYKQFQEKQKHNSLREFFKEFVQEILINTKNTFNTPSNVIKDVKKREKIDIPFLISATNMYGDLSCYLNNKMQKSAIEEIFELETVIKKTKDKELIINWRKLTTSDHFYNMYTNTNHLNKKAQDFESPYDAYIYYMNILNDLIIRTKIKEKKLVKQKEIMGNNKTKGIFQKIREAVKN